MWTVCCRRTVIFFLRKLVLPPLRASRRFFIKAAQFFDGRASQAREESSSVGIPRGMALVSAFYVIMLPPFYFVLFHVAPYSVSGPSARSLAILPFLTILFAALYWFIFPVYLDFGFILAHRHKIWLVLGALNFGLSAYTAAVASIEFAKSASFARSFLSAVIILWALIFLVFFALTASPIWRARSGGAIELERLFSSIFFKGDKDDAQAPDGVCDENARDVEFSSSDGPDAFRLQVLLRAQRKWARRAAFVEGRIGALEHLAARLMRGDAPCTGASIGSSSSRLIMVNKSNNASSWPTRAYVAPLHRPLSWLGGACIWGLSYFIALSLFCVAAGLAFPGGAFVREKIGFLPAFELLLFFFLLLCFLSFFSVIRRLGRISAVGDASLEAKRLFVFNVASMFTAHALFLTVLICVMGRPISNPHLYVFFHRIIASFHSQDYALLSIKAAFLCILIPVLLYQINYLLSGKITFQNFCLLSLMGWAGLFAIGLNNLLHAILVLDALSFVTAALVALCAWRGFGRAVAFALHYYVLSALTSVLGLAGCIMIYSVFQTFDVNTIIFLAGGEATSRLVESPAFLIGVFLVMVKVMFLLGLFPFQHYVVEVCGAANFGLLGFFLIVAKFPVLIFSTSLLKLMWLHFDSFKNFLLLTALVSIVYSALHILSVLRVKEFFAYSSINQYGFIAVLFYFEDLYSFYLAFLIYFIYAISTVILLVFLSFSRGFGRAGLGDGDVDTLSDLVRLINDSYLFHRAANDGARPGPAMYFYGGALAGFIALATVAGLPPLAGFFAKLHYVEIFMKHGYYYTLSAILITTLFTMFAYFNVGSALFAEYRRMDANNFIYYPRISSIDDLGGVILAALSVILLLLAFSSADGSALSIMRKLTMPFMWDNHFHGLLALRHEGLDLLAAGGSIDKDLLSYVVLLGQVGGWFGALVKKWATGLHFRGRYQTACDFWHKLVNGAACRRFRGIVSSLGPARGFLGGSFAVEYAWVLAALALLRMRGDYLSAEAEATWWAITVTAAIFWAALYFFAYLLFGSFAVYRATTAATTAIFILFPCLAARFLIHFSRFLDIVVGALDLSHTRRALLLEQTWLKIYMILLGLPALLVFLALAVAAYEYWADSFGRMTREREWQANMDLFRAYLRFVAGVVLVRWLRRYYLELFYLYGILLVWTPAGRGLLFTHDLYFLLEALKLTFKFFTFNYAVASFVFWFIIMNFVYAQIYKLADAGALRRHIEIFADYTRWAASPGVFVSYVFYFLLVVWLPASWALGVPALTGLVRLYISVLPDAQLIVVWSWVWFIFSIFYTGFSRAEIGQAPFLRAVYYFSLSICLYFINYCIAYNVASFDTNSGPDAGAHLLFGVELRVEFLDVLNLPLLLKETLTFGFDYLSLVLCTMSALVFSFVFLSNLHNESIRDKRAFFGLLLLVELFVLGAFLCTNLLGFFVFFESSLLPMAVLIGVWGSSEKKWFAAKQFLFYSLTCSLPMLPALLHLYRLFGTLDNIYIINNISQITAAERWYIWGALFLMFAVKVPMFPLHSWLLSAHVEAPTGGSVVLAAVLLKLGLYGFIRYNFGFFHDLSAYASTAVIMLALAGVVFSAASAITELDAKKVVAQTSIAHMNVAVIGLFMFDPRGFYGAIYLAVGHAVVSAALFYLIGTLYDRFHTRNLLLLGGLVQVMPLFSTALFFFTFANAGFPWSLSFVGELCVLVGVAKNISLLTFVVVVVSSVLLLYANLRLFILICFGAPSSRITSNAVTDLTQLELICCILLVLNAFILMINIDVHFFMLHADHLARNIF